MFYTFEFVVDVELRGHHDEAEDCDEGDCCLEEEGVPVADGVVTGVERPPEIGGHEGDQEVVHVPDCL